MPRYVEFDALPVGVDEDQPVWSPGLVTGPDPLILLTGLESMVDELPTCDGCGRRLADDQVAESAPWCEHTHCDECAAGCVACRRGSWGGDAA